MLNIAVLRVRLSVTVPCTTICIGDGFPQYLQLDDQDVLTDLVNDIVYRDIAVRYNIRDDHSLKSLLAYLMGNVGNLVSATKLKQILGMKSTSTVSDYFSYFEQTYLINLFRNFHIHIKRNC